jgi:hypothetical protein
MRNVKNSQMMNFGYETANNSNIHQGFAALKTLGYRYIRL